MIRTAIAVLLVFVTINASTKGQRLPRPGELPNDPIAGKSIELSNVPPWLKSYEFDRDSFTFVRIRYDGNSNRGRGSWATDYPAADLNLTAQLGSLTELDVSEPVRVLRLTDPALMSYSFTYLSEPGSLQLDDAEVKALRKYLDNDGFLMIDDFWGDDEWNHLHAVMKQVFPEREPQDLPLTHQLFNCVFKMQEKPQVTSIAAFLEGATTERSDAQAAHYRAYVDDDDRIMVLMCHNTDLADGWERVGTDRRYTLEMSKKRAFPMGINILCYVLSKAKQK